MSFAALLNVGLPSIYVGITANDINFNLLSAAGTPTYPVNVTCRVNGGITVGGTGGNTAFNIGAFPSGSIILLDNYGNIHGQGGASGGIGGDAVRANYSSQITRIVNNPGAQIYGGGGGGGIGGNGGAGGTGGQGYFYSYTTEGSFYNQSTYNVQTVRGSGVWTWKWNGTTLYTGAESTAISSGGWVYYRNVFAETVTTETKGGSVITDYYYIYRQFTNTNYTSGGAGGSGGSGGIGGVGQGYLQSSTIGSFGASGGAGASGGTNAGPGGYGGAGGQGGSGGIWGSAGSLGNSGAVGNTGNSGNYTLGSAGSSGSSGASGAAAGRYLLAGAAPVTFINNGSIAGTTA